MINYNYDLKHSTLIKALLCLVYLYISQSLNAQTVSNSYANAINTTFSGIDKSKAPHNLLVDYAMEFASGNYFGEYRIGGGLVLNGSSTTETPGNLTITNFDSQNFIISGTFEFTVLDDENNEINITNGRFDLNYTN